MTFSFNEIFVDITSSVSKIPKTEYNESGTIPIIDQSKNFICGYVDNAEKVCQQNQVIIFGDHTRVFKYIDFPFVIGADGVHVLKVINDKVDSKYIYYYLLASYIPNEGYSRHFKWVKKLSFDIPDIEKQRAIVKRLDHLFEMIKIKEKDIDELNKLIENIYSDSITKYDITTKKLVEVGDPIIGLTYSPEDITENGTIVLRSGNIQNGELDFEDLVRVDNKAIKEKLMVRENDILICSRNGSKRLVGKSCLLKDLKEKMTFGAFMTIFRSNINEYLIAFFKSVFFRNQLINSNTSTINQITTGMFKNIEIDIPNDEKVIEKTIEQYRIISKEKKLLFEDIKDLNELIDIELEKNFMC